MTQPTIKPLPETPNITIFRRLSVDANTLITTFIKRSVDEEGLDETWSDIVQSALVELSEYLELSQIIPRLAATRKAQSRARPLTGTAASERRKAGNGNGNERRNEAKSGKTKASDKPKENTDLELIEVEGIPCPLTDDVKLKQIHSLTSQPASASSSIHIFLTVSPPSEIMPDSDSDSNSHTIRELRECSFYAESYSWPFYNDGKDKYGDGGAVICGLDNWIADAPQESPRIVGGMFMFKNLTSMTVYESLVTVLKLSVYTYLSLVLEQHVISNLHIPIHYPPVPTPPLPSSPDIPKPPPEQRVQRSRSVKPSPGIWSYISRKTGGVIHRVVGTAGDGAVASRRTSLNFGSPFSSLRSLRHTTPMPEEITRSTISDTEVQVASQMQRLSVIQTAEGEAIQIPDQIGPFTSVLRQIQSQDCILSTSPKVTFPAPALIERLAQREEKHRGLASHAASSANSSLSSSVSSITIGASGSVPRPSSIRLTGIDETGLKNVLGWDARETQGAGMTGIRGFIRHQGLTALYNEEVVKGEEARTCGRPKLVSYRYWVRTPSADAERDQSLGEVVEHLCDSVIANEACTVEGCGSPRNAHRVVWTCGGVRVECTIKGSADRVAEDISMWQSCAVCGKETEVVKMDDVTYIFSFSKYLELLIWSPILSSLSICEHIFAAETTTTSRLKLDDSRFQVLRHFTYKGCTLTFRLASIVKNVYEMCFPKLQIVPGPVPEEEKYFTEAKENSESEEERQALETEITDWWRVVKAHLDSVESFLKKEADQVLRTKNLPPLPASDDEDSDEESTLLHTPSPKHPQPSQRSPSRQENISSVQPSQTGWLSLRSSKPAAPYPPGSSISSTESCRLLEQLRISFQNTEDSLRRQVAITPASSLNDARRVFHSTAQGTVKRLAAWQLKHVPGTPACVHFSDVASADPEWWSGNCHAVPGGRVVVREGEWGSIIAFTLSSLDYQRELATMNAISGLPSQSPSPPSSLSASQSPSPSATIKAKKSTTAFKLPDPDASDTALWEETESCTTVVTRREHPRDVSSLLLLPILGSQLSGSLSRSFTPPQSTWAQPQAPPNVEPTGEASQTLQTANIGEKVPEPQTHEPNLGKSTRDSRESTIALSSLDSQRNGPRELVLKNSLDDTYSDNMNTAIASPKPIPATAVPIASPSGDNRSVGGSSFTGTLSNVMRYFLNPSPSRAPSPDGSTTHHGFSTSDSQISNIDEHPHIKHEWTIGQRLKFSCTAYYAKQFDALRKRCGIENDMIKSLERSENWTAVGGKSKSNFWKSSDDRFIIKTLVNAWNVADLQVLIEIAPSYFHYIDLTAKRASALAKLLGFYTVEVKNLETGKIVAKHDLLVTENLFYKQKVTQTYDLKGIQSRAVKPNGDRAEKTLFDAEWIGRQQRAPLLIQPHSVYILHEALRADADFLAKMNIMDYSLLLGIDDEHREISCGLVDTIGSYTFAKTLEYKAKQNLKSGKGKAVTVIPPGEYQNRFVSSIESYFVICPDKWTKPPCFIDRTKLSDLVSII